MDILEAIRSRKSIRSYKADSVPRAILHEILAIATRAPSAANMQPWEFAVLTGQVLDDIKRGNVERLAAGVQPNPDIHMQPATGIYRQRQSAVYQQIHGLLGIGQEERDKKAEWTQMGFIFYDAPVVIIIYRDVSLGESQTQFDIGLIAQTICLAALNYGLGTCIDYRAIGYPDLIKKYAAIPESKKIVIAIAIGYPDWDFAANKLVTKREPIDNITIWCGFD